MDVVTGPITSTKVGVLVCVDSYYCSELRGVMYSQLLPKPFAFQNVVQLIGKMDRIYDTYSFPQIFFSKRTFGRGQPRGRTLQKKEATYMPQEIAEIAMDAQGSKGTFLINVLFRQNATWQGTISWVEKDRKQHFRSALEMIRLIDEALAEADETNSVTWEKERFEATQLQ